MKKAITTQIAVVTIKKVEGLNPFNFASWTYSQTPIPAIRQTARRTNSATTKTLANMSSNIKTIEMAIEVKNLFPRSENCPNFICQSSLLFFDIQELQKKGPARKNRAITSQSYTLRYRKFARVKNCLTGL